MFLVYDRLVEFRQGVVLNQARKTTAIVSSLFPESVTKRLMAEKAVVGKKFLSQSNRLQKFLKNGDEMGSVEETKPIADLFPYTTVLFGGTFADSDLSECTNCMLSHSLFFTAKIFLASLHGALLGTHHKSLCCSRRFTRASTKSPQSTKSSRWKQSATPTLQSRVSRNAMY